HEAFGQSCLEALVLGRPVICLDWGGPGMIVDENTGWTVKPETRDETIKGIARAIAALASEDEERRELRRGECRKRALSSFHWKQLTAKILEVYLSTKN
ncbi:glycosyltransferase, partial [bacterium]|nr:glycosyltransferase [bacterium]